MDIRHVKICFIFDGRKIEITVKSYKQDYLDGIKKYIRSTRANFIWILWLKGMAKSM